MVNINKKEFVPAHVHEALTPGEALKILRELQGLSQNDLAQMTHIAQANISAIESGTRQLGKDRAIALAEALHVHPAVLLFPDWDSTTMTSSRHFASRRRRAVVSQQPHACS